MSLLVEHDGRAQQACSASGPCPTLLASNVGGSKLVVDGSWIYVDSASGVMRVSKTGIATQVTHRPVNSFTVDRGDVYWSESGRINVTSNGITTTIAQPTATTITDLVVTHSLVFWIADGGEVQVVPVQHGTIMTLARVRPARPWQFAAIRDLVTDGTYLYWIANDEIQRSQLSGSPSTIVRGRYPRLFASGSTVYVSELGADLATLAPTGQLTRFGPSGVLGDTFAASGSVFCWASRFRSFMARVECATQGSRGISSYQTSSATPAIALDASNLYYVTTSGDLISLKR